MKSSIIPWLEFVEICCIPSSLDNPCLFKLPIPTLKEGITIGDTMEAILVTQVGVVEEVFIDMLSSDVASTALVILVFCGGWLGANPLTDVLLVGLSIQLSGSWLIAFGVDDEEDAAAITSFNNDSLLSPFIRFSMSRRLTSLSNMFYEKGDGIYHRLKNIYIYM